MVTKEHNQETEQEKNSRISFHQTLNSLKEKKSEIASKTADMNQLYKLAEAHGWDKADFVYAMSIDPMKSEGVVEDLQKKIKIAGMMGMSEANLFSIQDKDRTPLTEKAFQFGKAAGLARLPAKSPYDPGSEQDQKWLEGHHEGTAEINTELAQAVDEIIPGDGDDGGETQSSDAPP